VYSEKYRCFQLVLQLLHADCKYREMVVFTDEPFCTSCPHFVTHSLTSEFKDVSLYSYLFYDVYTSIYLYLCLNGKSKQCWHKVKLLVDLHTEYRTLTKKGSTARHMV